MSLNHEDLADLLSQVALVTYNAGQSLEHAHHDAPTEYRERVRNLVGVARVLHAEITSLADAVREDAHV